MFRKGRVAAMISATSASRNALRVSKVYVTACLCLFIARVLESHQQSPKKNETKDFIERIDVEGYRRLELATIRAHFLSRPGELYSAEVVQRDAQTLRDTEYFEEVRLRSKTARTDKTEKLLSSF